MAERLHALDRLRAGAMLAGVGFHAALAHSPMVQPWWLTADRSQAPVLDLLLWPLHLVRMPLFFWLAGLLAADQVARRGTGGLLRDRLRRVLLPLVLGVPLMHWTLEALVRWAAATVQHPSPLLRLVQQAWAEGWPAPPPTTGHLWFLAYLMLFTLLLWVARTLVPPAWRARLQQAPAPLVVGLLPLVLVPALASVPAPHPAPDGLLPQFWAVAFYGAFFALGTGSRPWLPGWARPRTWLAFGAGALLCMGAFGALLRAPVGPGAWAVAAVSGAAAVWGCVALVGGAWRWTAPAGPAVRFLADAAYWVYLVHLPLVLALQFALTDWAAPWFVKLPLVLALTLALSLGSFALWVREGALGRYLLGRPRVAAG